MSNTKIRSLAVTAAVAAGVALTPTTAQAGFMAEMKAAGKVERKVSRMYPRYNPTASCDQISSRKFWCSYVAMKGDCMVTGKARVTSGRVRIVANNKNCF